jgi:hypothetical protein
MPPSLYDTSHRFADEARLKDEFQVAQLYRESVTRWVLAQAAGKCERCRAGEAPRRGPNDVWFHEHEGCAASDILGQLP